MNIYADKEAILNRYRYGDTLLWVLGENIGGSQAKFLFGQIQLHFSDRRTPLVVDLRGTSFIDSEGASALEHSRRRHPELVFVGTPREFSNLPLAIRASLTALRPAATIEAALSTLHRRTLSRRGWDVPRRHCRIPVEIPVEIFSRNVSAAAMLQDLSLGGGRLTLSPGLVKHLGEGGNGTIAITGITGDPLGREVAARYASTALASRPVHVLPEMSGLGVRFAQA